MHRPALTTLRSTPSDACRCLWRSVGHAGQCITMASTETILPVHSHVRRQRKQRTHTHTEQVLRGKFSVQGKTFKASGRLSRLRVLVNSNNYNNLTGALLGLPACLVSLTLRKITLTTEVKRVQRRCERHPANMPARGQSSQEA